MKSFRRWGPTAAVIYAFLWLGGCTPPRGETSSAPVQEKGGPKAPPGDLRDFKVVDRAARWESLVRATDEPKVVTHAGYVHVRVAVGQARPVDCFVYDAPLVTGQAVTRLLNAAQIGIRYERVSLERVDVSAGNPLVLVKADFSDDETGKRAQLFVGLVPKVKLPVVCSQEAPSSGAVLRTLRELSGRMDPASDFSVDSLAEEEELLVFELWTLFDADRPIGFRQWRAARTPNGEVTTLEIASLFESHDTSVITTDVRISERSDDRGLLLSDWLELVDGQMHARAVLERNPEKNPESPLPFSYRVGGVGPRGPSTDALETEFALRSAYDEHVALLGAWSDTELFEFPRFLPHMNPDDPISQVSELPPSSESTARLQVGARVFEYDFESGAPTRRRELGSSRRAELLLRLLGGSGG